MAQVIGRPGLDALRKTAAELARVRADLGQTLRNGHLYAESEIDAIYAALSEPTNWLKGAQGECRTAAALDALPEHFVVFHDFHYRSRSGQRSNHNIDHIVLGPSGLFVIDTKNYSAPLVESADTSKTTSKNVDAVLRQVTDVKRWVRTAHSPDLADLFVRGVVVYARPGVTVERRSEGEVLVLPLADLASKLLRMPEKLTFNQIARIRKIISARRAPSVAL